jgi:hypothetical protein
MFTFDGGSGRVNCQDAGLGNGSIVFKLDRFTVRSENLRWEADADAHVAKGGDCRIRVETKGGALSVGIENQGADGVFLDEISVVFHAADSVRPMRTEDYLEFIHGLNFAESSGVKKVGLSNRWLPHNPESSMVYVLKETEGDRSILFGGSPVHRGDNLFFKALHDRPHLQGNFGILIKSEQKRRIAPGAEAWMTSVMVAVGTDPLKMLESYGESHKAARKRPLRPVQAGWNSWDYFSGSISAEDMGRNAAAARTLFGDKVRCLVIDEGWEPRWGDWVANWKFPGGLGTFCKEAKAKGMVPGIWTAPIMVNRYTQLYREHPEWFALDAAGQVAVKSFSYGPMSFLDVTLPEVRQWLFDMFTRLRGEGFEYFKVDFTQEMLNAEKFHDATVGRGQLVRLVFQTIREAIGEDAYLLACGAPYPSVTGIVDASRASGDIHNFWGHVLCNAGSIASRYWQHRRLWNNDPDFVIARSRETANGKYLNKDMPFTPFDGKAYWLSGREMNEREIRAYLLFLYLSAGDMMLSDDLPDLKENAVGMIARILEHPLSAAARPVDLFANHAGLPSLYVARETDFTVVGMFNWEEDRQEVELVPKDLGIGHFGNIQTFWEGRPVRAQDGTMRLSLPPRSGEAFVFSARQPME